MPFMMHLVDCRCATPCFLYKCFLPSALSFSAAAFCFPAFEWLESRQKDRANTRVNHECYVCSHVLCGFKHYRHGFGAKRRFAKSLGHIAVKENAVLWRFTLQICDRPILLKLLCFCFLCFK